MADNTTQVSDQINSAVNSALGVGALAAIYTGNFVNFGKEGGALALIAKTITENGVYSAASDGADGYSVVTVETPTGIKILAGTEEPTEDIGENGQLYLKYFSGRESIPNNYKFIDYLQSDGSHFINTGYIYKKNTVIKCKVQIDSSGQPAYPCPFGARRLPAQDSFDVFAYSDRSLYDRDSGDAEFSSPIPYAEIVEIEAGGTSAKWMRNGVEGGSVSVSGSNIKDGIYHLDIFTLSTGLNSDYGPETRLKMKLFYFDIYEGETLISHYIPVLDDSGLASLYDEVTGTTLHKSTWGGGNDFTYGEILVNNRIYNAYVKTNDTWQSLIGNDIENVNLGGE